MTEEELDLAEMVLCLTNKLNLLKQQLAEAQTYKDDAERYRYCLENSFPVLVKSGVAGISDYWVCYRTILRAIIEVGKGETPIEAIDKAMKD